MTTTFHRFPYVRRRLWPEIRDRFNAVRGLTAQVPDMTPFLLSCHALAHALVTRVHGVSVVRGHFHGAWDHSWLATEDRGHRQWIIDPYPWATLGGPVIVLNDPRTPWASLYRPDPTAVVTPDDEQVQWLLEQWGPPKSSS